MQKSTHFEVIAEGKAGRVDTQRKTDGGVRSSCVFIETLTMEQNSKVPTYVYDVNHSLPGTDYKVSHIRKSEINVLGTVVPVVYPGYEAWSLGRK